MNPPKPYIGSTTVLPNKARKKIVRMQASNRARNQARKLQYFQNKKPRKEASELDVAINQVQTQARLLAAKGARKQAGILQECLH